MTRSRFGILSAIVLLLATTAFSGTAAGTPGAEKQRPLKVSLEISSTATDIECEVGEPTGQVGTGHISHLGRVEISGGHCTDFTNFPTVRLLDGRGTYVAANGDTIEITYSGQATPIEDSFTGEGSAQIVGGTGRFHAASGAFDFTVITPVLPDGSLGTALLDGQGWIAYDASNRRNK